MTWSQITRSRGAIDSRRMPVAPEARMCVTPSFFRAKMLARYGTSDGLNWCDRPCRARTAVGWPPTSVIRMGEEGLPNGVLDLDPLAARLLRQGLSQSGAADQPHQAIAHGVSPPLESIHVTRRQPHRRRQGTLPKWGSALRTMTTKPPSAVATRPAEAAPAQRAAAASSVQGAKGRASAIPSRKGSGSRSRASAISGARRAA